MDESERAERAAREAEGYFELELYEEAMERAEALLAAGHMAEFASTIRAECLRSLGRHAEGAEAFERILATRPDEISAWVGLGWCRKRAGRLDLAVRAMEDLVARRPEEAIGHYNLACYLALAGDTGRAAAALEEAVRREERFRDLARGESDFDPIRGDERFRRIVEEET